MRKVSLLLILTKQMPHASEDLKIIFQDRHFPELGARHDTALHFEKTLSDFFYLFTLYFARKQKFDLCVSTGRTLTGVTCCLAYFLEKLQIKQPYYCCAS